MTDDSGETRVAEIVKIEQQTPWYLRPAAIICMVALSLSLFSFAVGTVVDRISYRHQNDDLREVASALKSQNDELSADNRALEAELECRSQRNAELATITSQITGEQARLVVLIIQRVQDPEAIAPILANLQDLAAQREVAAGRLVAGVQECQIR